LPDVMGNLDRSLQGRSLHGRSKRSSTMRTAAAIMATTVATMAAMGCIDGLPLLHFGDVDFALK